MNKKSLVFILFTFAFIQSFATTWKTILPGYWINPNIWQNGIAPPFTCGDTILIQHPIVITNTITLTAGAHFIIDNSGGVCGHHQMIVQANATIIKYGIFEMDILTVPGGYVEFNMPGNWKLVNYGLITNNGVFQVNGAAGGVGPWFDCQMPEYGFLTGLNDEEIINDFYVFPNPSAGVLKFTNYKLSGKIDLRITNTTGAVIFEKAVANSSTIEIEGLAPGIYFYNVILDENKLSKSKKIIVSH